MESDSGLAPGDISCTAFARYSGFFVVVVEDASVLDGDIFKSISKADPISGDVGDLLVVVEDVSKRGSVVDETITHFGPLSVVVLSLPSLLADVTSSSLAGNIHGLGWFEVS